MHTPHQVKKITIIVAVVIIALALIIAGIIFAVKLLTPKPVLPVSVTNQVSYIVLALEPSEAIRIDSTSAKYDAKDKILSYNVTLDGIKVVVSMQPTPEMFTDIPQTFDKVLADMSEYSKFETYIGTVHLTKPKNLEGRQVAVLNAKGTLMFAKPDSDLTDDQWRLFFKNMDILKP